MTDIAHVINRYRQQGAVLVVSLLILLVVTVLAVTSVTTTSMEEKMASNTRQKQIAFEAAEAALRAGEAWLTDATNLTNRTQIRGLFDGTGGLFSERYTDHSASAPVDFDVLDPGEWVPASPGTPEGVAVDFPNNANPTPPRYVIEYVGRVNPGGGVGPPLDYSGGGTLEQFAFRITAIGWGMDTNAYYVLASTLRLPL